MNHQRVKIIVFIGFKNLEIIFWQHCKSKHLKLEGLTGFPSLKWPKLRFGWEFVVNLKLSANLGKP